MPRLTRAAAAATAAVSLGVLASAPAAGGETPVSDARVAARFDPATGQTPESVVLERDGSADLTFALARQVVHVTRQGVTRILATLPAEAAPYTPLVHQAMAMGIARAQDGTLYVNYATGTSRTGIWRVGPAGGTPQQIAELPADGLPNGLALDERRGMLYAADSVLGTVWRVPSTGGTPTAWARSPRLAPVPGAASAFGANGVKVHRQAVWVSNSGAGTLLRIPVGATGSAGGAETRASGLDGIDDFAFAGPGTTVLAALNPSSQVVLVGPDGSRSAALTRQDGLSNPTSVAVLGRSVYVASAAYSTLKDPNLLLAQLRRQYSR